ISIQQSAAAAWPGQTQRRGGVPGFDATAFPAYTSALMPADLPESVDAWRMVSARRCFEGDLPLGAMTRLLPSVLDPAGQCRYRMQFDRDPLGFAVVELGLEAELVLMCQRSLEPFRFPVKTSQRLGLIRDESEEAGLPGDVEPVLV